LVDKSVPCTAPFISSFLILVFESEPGVAFFLIFALVPSQMRHCSGCANSDITRTILDGAGVSELSISYAGPDVREGVVCHDRLRRIAAAVNDAEPMSQNPRFIRNLRFGIIPNYMAQRWRFCLDIAGVGVAAAGVMMAAVAAVFLFRQQHTMQGQLDEMVAEQRPWVFFDNPAVASDLVFDDNGARVYISFALKNTGHTPAVNVGMKTALVPVLPNDKKWFNSNICNKYVVHPCEEALAQSKANRGLVIFPNANNFLVRQPIEIDKNGIDCANAIWHHFDNSSTFVSLLVTMCAGYGTTFDDSRHKSEMTFFLSRPNVSKPEISEPIDSSKGKVSGFWLNTMSATAD